jgi:hypothetical protein
MGKAVFRILRRMLGLCILLVGLVYGRGAVRSLSEKGLPLLTHDVLNGLLWFLFGALLPFFTGGRRARFALTAEPFVCCVLCVGLAWVVWAAPAWLPRFLWGQAGLLQGCLLFSGGMFFNRAVFRVR